MRGFLLGGLAVGMPALCVRVWPGLEGRAVSLIGLGEICLGKTWALMGADAIDLEHL